MITKTKLLGRLTRGALALAMFAAIGTAAFPQLATAGNRHPDAVKLSLPVTDNGDSHIRDMPVVGGHRR